ncbi:MAG: FemAB family XrtA/PEP-CTERM system-associated protein [Planctomycetota bacterium]|jgi:FemAB-related protein (PEP-CTERM system-associated)
MTTKIGLLDVDKFYEWDRFVREAEGGTLFHLTRWQDLIRNNFTHKPYYLYSERDGQITGVLPLMHVRSSLLGSVLVSTPYAVYGGVVANQPEDAEKLVLASQELARRLNVRHVEYRQFKGTAYDLPSIDLYHTFIREIPEDEEECLKIIPRKSRASARQGRDKFHLRFVHANNQIDRFYELFVMNKRLLGSPVFSKKYFRTLMDIFDGRVFIHCVLHEQKIVSAVMSFVYKNTVLPYYSGSEKQYERMQINNYQYWQLMAWACRRGMRFFDFGRSRKDTGAFKFKANMGFDSTELKYQYFFPKEGKIPSVNPSNPKYNLPKMIMRNIPIPLAKVVGPLLVKHIP